MFPLAAVCLALSPLVSPGLAATDDPVVLGGRVVDVARDRPGTKPAERSSIAVVRGDGSGQEPIAGASVVVRESIPGGWSTDERLTTDVDGRFSIALPPDLAAEPRLQVAVIRVERPGYVTRVLNVPETGSKSLAGLIQARRLGDAPTLGTIGLARGVELTGQFVEPDGKPAVGVTVHAWPWVVSVWQTPLDDDTSTVTDADGRFRIVVPRRMNDLSLCALPERFATYRHRWEYALLADPAADRPPTDLGRLTLEPGQTVSGRLLDVAGRPLAGRTLGLDRVGLEFFDYRTTGFTTQPRFLFDHRTALTDADGRFSFRSIRPGNYSLGGDGRVIDGHPSPDSVVLHPVAVFVGRGVDPAPIEVREPETNEVEVRFVEPDGRPIPGNLASLSLARQENAGPFRKVFATNVQAAAPGKPPVLDLKAQLNADPTPSGEELPWRLQGRADADGRIRFRALRGISQFSPSPTLVDDLAAISKINDSYNQIMARDLKSDWPAGGVRRVEYVVTQPVATVVLTVQTEDGLPWAGSLSAALAGPGLGTNEVRFTRQADGRYRGRLRPDDGYEVRTGGGDEYVPNPTVLLKMAAGAVVERTVRLRRPVGPRVGDVAPAFTSQGLDHRAIRLGEYRGRTVLVHFWRPGRTDDLRAIRAIVSARAGSPKFAALGLILVRNPAWASDTIWREGIDWPQAVLSGVRYDPTVFDYGEGDPPAPVLIGPDGRIVARGVARTGGFDLAPIATALDTLLGPPGP